MKIDLGFGELCLQNGDPLRLTHASGTRLRCVSGILWITQAGEAGDIFLAPGQSHLIDSKGLVLIESIGAGRIRLEIQPRRGTARRWLAWAGQLTTSRKKLIPRPAAFNRTDRAASVPGFPA